jgi:recombinational DNA repair protein (RecF pathway)
VVDDVFRAIAKGHTRPELLRAFELKLLAYVGHLPDLKEAVDYPLQKVAAYDPASGHLLATAEFGTVAFDEDARVSALALLNAPIADVPSQDAQTLRQIAKIFSFRLHEQKKGPLKSVEFLKELGV